MSTRYPEVHEQSGVEETLRPTKRPRFEMTNHPTTTQTWREMRSAYNVQMSQSKFTGICSYLYVILKWGFLLSVNDLDRFIYNHECFERKIPDLERACLDAVQPGIPAYHEWFLRNWEDNDMPARGVLNEHVLREIWRENPYTFLRTEYSLEFIAQVN